MAEAAKERAQHEEVKELAEAIIAAQERDRDHREARLPVERLRPLAHDGRSLAEFALRFVLEQPGVTHRDRRREDSGADRSERPRGGGRTLNARPRPNQRGRGAEAA